MPGFTYSSAVAARAGQRAADHGALPERDRGPLDAHLADCPHCSEYLAQLRVTVEALGRVRSEDLPDQAVDAMVDLFVRWNSD